MYACCANCLSSTWIEATRPTGEIRTIACGECPQTYVVTHSRELGNTAAEHYRAMVRLANASDIDMPCAYSVLLGVMPMAQAKAIRRSRGQAHSAPEPEREALPDNLDPDFHRAVREGSLTIRSALNRGSREAFATALVNRHGLPRALAFDVADNRVSLRQAIGRAREAKKAKQQRAARSAVRGAPVLRKLIVAGVATLSLAVISGISWTWSINHRRYPAVARRVHPVAPARVVAQVDTAQKTATALARASNVRTDDQGQVTEIVGSDPRSVLLSYCDAVSGFLGVEPLAIRGTAPQFRNARLGVFRDHNDGGALRAIRIRLDSRSGRWVAGSGRAPIRPSDASELPPDDGSIDVARR